MNLLKCRRWEVELLRQLEKGGREKKQFARHSIYHRGVLEYYFGIPAFGADVVVYEAMPQALSNES